MEQKEGTHIKIKSTTSWRKQYTNNSSPTPDHMVALSTKTDHKLVKAEFKIQWGKMQKQHAKSIKINIDKFREPKTTSAYKVQIDSKITNIHNIHEESL